MSEKQPERMNERVNDLENSVIMLSVEIEELKAEKKARTLEAKHEKWLRGEGIKAIREKANESKKGCDRGESESCGECPEDKDMKQQYCYVCGKPVFKTKFKCDGCVEMEL